MIKEDEYELLPHKEIVRLREEVDRLKENPVSSEASNLISSLNRLNESMSRLIRIFEVAEKELVQEYKQGRAEDKLNRVVYQNKEIAKGIIAVADLIKKRQVVVQSPSVMPSKLESQPPSLAPEPVNEEPVDPISPAVDEPTPTEASSVEGTVPPPPEKKKITGWFTK